MFTIRKYDLKLSHPMTILKCSADRVVNGVRIDWQSAICIATTSLGRNQMREWNKPSIVETESGMEVTSYLPAELDRA